MKYTLVKPDGTFGDTRDFAGVPPTLTPNKGKWLPDSPPDYNPATHVRTLGTQSTNNQEIVYVVVPRSPADIVREAKEIVKQNAIDRISEIRLELIDLFVESLIGTPAEKTQALAAIGVLRTALVNEKSKL